MLFTPPDDALAWFTIDGLLALGVEVRISRPSAVNDVSPYVGSSQQGSDFGLVAALCTSADKGIAWEWNGMFSW
jgi:hypothetical protein